jgi:RNA polymerase sigma factor (TIGR02999 family)
MKDDSAILTALHTGDPQAAAQLLPLVYEELRQLAAQKLVHEKPGQTLDATALVHEAYIKLVGPADEARWRNRSHFFHAAAEAMRRILIDNARRKRSEKRGGGRQRFDADDHLAAPAKSTEDLLAIDEALAALEAEDTESAQLVKLRFYAGLSVEEAGEALGLPRATAYRTWSYAKAWLKLRLSDHIQRGSTGESGLPG